MTLSRLTKHGHYHQLALRNDAGGIEVWLLTDNEVERIRERAIKYPHLVIPVIVAEEQQGWSDTPEQPHFDPG
jgi:hypothetical protein